MEASARGPFSSSPTDHNRNWPSRRASLFIVPPNGLKQDIALQPVEPPKPQSRTLLCSSQAAVPEWTAFHGTRLGQSNACQRSYSDGNRIQQIHNDWTGWPIFARCPIKAACEDSSTGRQARPLSRGAVAPRRQRKGTPTSSGLASSTIRATSSRLASSAIRVVRQGNGVVRTSGQLRNYCEERGGRGRKGLLRTENRRAPPGKTSRALSPEMSSN